MIGRTLSHYEVLDHLGSGGMGEVFRARDTKLGREVALKTLPPGLLEDPERIARLEREARSLATLQHSNVATIYGWEDSPEARFLVMELVEGENLSARIGRGPIPVADAVDIALQITEGLGAAHDKGLVHRDLKPANVMISPDGQVKILDFGLARAWAGDAEEGDPAHSPTLTAAMTMAGTILGTAGYMSPEQARGQTADRRADIWAAGVILYEMLTGRQLFAGETVSDTLAAVLTRDPDLQALPADTPAAVRRGLARCLEKDPRRRLHDIADLRLELLAAKEGAGEAGARAEAGGGASRERKGRLPIWLAPAAVLLAVLAGAAGLVIGRGGAPAPVEQVLRMSIDGAGFNGWSCSTISPDGTQIAWSPFSMSGDQPLRIRKLDGFESRVLAGTEDAANPTFSPDGQWIVYMNNGDESIYKVPVNGGAPQQMVQADQNFVNSVWADDGYIYFAGGGSNMNDRGIRRIPAGGGPVEEVTLLKEGEGQHLHPALVPGTPWLLFTVEGFPGSAIYAVRLDGELPVREDRTLVVDGASTPRFVAPDVVVFHRPATFDLAAVRVDPSRMTQRGDPVTVLREVSTSQMLRGCYEISRNGTLIYNHGEESGLVSGKRVVQWAAPGGETVPVFPQPSSWAQPRLSPDGRHLVLRRVNTPNCVLWNFDLVRGTLGRITVDVDAHDPLWNPATGDVVFRYDAGNDFFLASRRADGTGETTILFRNPDTELAPTSFSPDGRWLLVDALYERGDVSFLDLEEGGGPQPFLDSSFRERNGAFSPDARWVAYCSNESGRDEVYVVAWPSGDHRLQVSIDGGEDPVWSRDGRRLYFIAPPGIRVVDMVGAADGTAAAAFTAEAPGPGPDPAPGIPGTYLAASFDNKTYRHSFDIAPDEGRAVFVSANPVGNEDQDLRVVLGWGGELRERFRE